MSKEPKPYVIKYDYDDMYGFGTTIVFANDMDDAVNRFRHYMMDKRDSKWLEYTFNRADFRWVSKNVFGWNIFFNDSANVCLKVREICTQYGDIIPIQEHFEYAKIK